MRPLGRVAGIYGRFLLLYLVAMAFQGSYGFSPAAPGYRSAWTPAIGTARELMASRPGPAHGSALAVLAPAAQLTRAPGGCDWFRFPSRPRCCRGAALR